jgi:hypothetical protein
MLTLLPTHFLHPIRYETKVFFFILQGPYDGVQHSELMGFRTLTNVRYSKGRNISGTGYVSVLS